MNNKSNGSKTNRKNKAAVALAGAAIAGAVSPSVKPEETLQEAEQRFDKTLSDDQREVLGELRNSASSILASRPPLGTPEHEQYKSEEHQVEAAMGLPQDSLDPRA